MTQSSVFSKLDLKWGYHQLELSEEARGITTFTTHAGLYPYKRLMFGITSAPERNHHAIQQVLHGCEGYMKSKSYTRSKQPLVKFRSSNVCQSIVKQSHFKYLKEKKGIL